MEGAEGDTVVVRVIGGGGGTVRAKMEEEVCSVTVRVCRTADDG